MRTTYEGRVRFASPWHTWLGTIAAKNGVELRSVVAGTGKTLYFDSSLYDTGFSFNSVQTGGALIAGSNITISGSTITMTVPIGPNSLESDVAKVLDQELADLIQLAQL